MEIWIWVIAGIVLGAAAGAAFTYWWTRARGGGDTIGQLKRENQKFREEVTEHFVETARLINRLTDSYKEVFDHLNKGASELVDENALAERLPASGSEEVRLRRLGAPARASDAASDSNGDAAGSSTASSSASAATSTASKGAADGGTRRAPHERADIEAGPRREAEKRPDRDIDPLKRQRGDADARDRSDDRSDYKLAPDRSGNGEKGEQREKSAEVGDRSSNNDGDSASTPSSAKSGGAASSGSAGTSPSASDDHQRKSGGT